MSDAPKTDAPKAEEPKAAPAAAQPEEAKAAAPKPPAAAKPAEAASAAKPAAAPAAKPAPAAAKAEPPKPAPVPGKTSAPKPPDPSNVIRLELSTKAIVAMFSALVLLILFFGGTTIVLLIRLNDPVYRVTHQPPGLDKPGYSATASKGAASGTPAASGAAVDVGEASPEPSGGADSAAPIEDVKIGEKFEKLDGTAPDLSGSWPTFRGPRYDNISADGPRLADRWPEKGPRVLWSQKLGEGYAGAAIHKGRVYLLDYDDEKKEDVLRCFALHDGKEMWRRSYHVKVRKHHGFTRTVPAVTDTHVVTMGPYCHVMCVDARTGDLKWGMDLRKDYGTKLPDWHTAQCPLIDGNTVVLAPAGPDVLMMGVDLETGQVKWKTPNPNNWRMSHSSVIPMTVNGKKTYAYCAIGGTFGVSAEPADAGTMLWSTLAWNKPQVISSSPVPLEDGHIYLTTGYSAGSMLIKVEPDWSVKMVWTLGVREGVACEQHTPIAYQGLIFSVLPKDAGAYNKQFVATDPLKGGKVLWASGKEKRFGDGLGPFILADGKFYLLTDDGTLVMARASTSGYEELARAKLFSGREAWAPIAVADGRMIVRDNLQMLCIDVTQGAE